MLEVIKRLKKFHDAELPVRLQSENKRTLSHSPTGAVSFFLLYTELHLLRRGQIAPLRQIDALRRSHLLRVLRVQDRLHGNFKIVLSPQLLLRLGFSFAFLRRAAVIKILELEREEFP